MDLEKEIEILREENKKLREEIAIVRLRRIHSAIKDRCYNKNHRQYKNYGGRGIIMCEEWRRKGGFKNFYKWSMENGYSENLTIDRIDNDKGYSPDNCRWATHTEQGNNTSRNKILELNGERHTVAEWARINGVRPCSYYNRVSYGWSDKDILTRPLKNCKNRKLPQ